MMRQSHRSDVRIKTLRGYRAKSGILWRNEEKNKVALCRLSQEGTGKARQKALCFVLALGDNRGMPVYTTTTDRHRRIKIEIRNTRQEDAMTLFGMKINFKL